VLLDHFRSDDEFSANHRLPALQQPSGSGELRQRMRAHPSERASNPAAASTSAAALSRGQAERPMGPLQVKINGRFFTCLDCLKTFYGLNNLKTHLNAHPTLSGQSCFSM
jgi:LYAR-type C2HC zinc finger